MSITKEQQQALDDALVPKEQRLTIGSCNNILSTTFNPKEPTFQVALDMCPKLPGQEFVDPPFEKDILTFMRELGYSGNIKLLSDVKVDTLPQPWRTFGTIINKCLSGKVTRIDTLRLSRAQILWGLYHQENVDYVYLLWEDLVFQIENKESRKNKYMFYPRFTKVIINHFISQDQSIPRRNKVDWHMANDDPILTTMRFIPQHEVVQPKPKYVRQSSRTKTDEAPNPSSDKRVKATAKKSSEEEGDDEENVSEHEDDDDNERTKSNNDDDDEEVQGVNIEGEAMDEASNNEEDEGNELYMDLNVNLEGRDVEMMDDQPTNVQTTQVTEDTHVIITPVIPEGQQ
ncbi:hypothetical protein Tco_1436962 [Tanacetum coccineum]